MTQPQNLVDLLHDSIRAYGSRHVFGTKKDGVWRWMTYVELGRRVDAFRGALHELGVGEGDRVAIISENRVEWAVGAYAALGLGAAYVPMYPAQDAREQRHILADSGAKICLVSGPALAARVTEMRPDLPLLTAIVDLDEIDPLLEDGKRDHVPAVSPTGQHLAEIVYTSGTTGVPKGVRLTHGNIVSNLTALEVLVPFGPGDRSLAFLPWSHVFGGDELHGLIRLGAEMAISTGPEHLGDEMREVRPTVLFAVPRVFNTAFHKIQQSIAGKPAPVRALFRHGMRVHKKVARGDGPPLLEMATLRLARRLVFSRIADRFGGRLRYVVSAAAALSPDIIELFDAVGVPLLEAYGMTEASACVTLNTPEARRPGSVGRPIPGVEVRLDPDVPGAGEGEGEIVIYGHGVMDGYHQLPDKTRETMTADGGLRSGDMGRIDQDGFLWLTGRLKELYKLENGKYVAPAPIEERMTTSAFISQALVHGAGRPYNVALIVPDHAALKTWAAEQGITAGSREQLVADARVHALLQEEIDKVNAHVRGFEKVERFALLSEPFSLEAGLLTPTLKLKRNRVEARYASQLADLYRGEQAVTTIAR